MAQAIILCTLFPRIEYIIRVCICKSNQLTSTPVTQNWIVSPMWNSRWKVPNDLFLGMLAFFRFDNVLSITETKWEWHVKDQFEKKDPFLVYNVEGTGHITIEWHLINLLVSLFFCPLLFSPAVSSTSSNSQFKRKAPFGAVCILCSSHLRSLPSPNWGYPGVNRQFSSSFHLIELS